MEFILSLITPVLLHMAVSVIVTAAGGAIGGAAADSAVAAAAGAVSAEAAASAADAEKPKPLTQNEKHVCLAGVLFLTLIAA